MTEAPPESTRLEQAQALGFNNVAEMEEHQTWLDGLKRHRDEVVRIVARFQFQSIIDMRNVYIPTARKDIYA